jgi:hypothetical protein
MNHGLKRSVIAAGLALSCTTGFDKAQAAVITWNGTTSTVWATGSNWTPTGPPITTSGVTINSGVNHQPTIAAGTFVQLNGTGGSLTVNSGAVLTIASPGGTLSMNSGNHPITLNGGSIIDSGALFANVINLNGGSIDSGPVGSAGGIQVNSGAHFSASFISGHGSIGGPLTLSGGIFASGGTTTLTGGVAPNSLTVTKTGIVDLDQNLSLASLFGDSTSTCFPSCINYGTLNLDGFNVQVAGVPLPTGFYTNPTNDTVVDILNTSFVPEASTWAMMLLGFAGLGYAAFRISNKNVAATV